MKQINPYKSPEPQQATGSPQAEPKTKPPTGVWRVATLFSFILLLFVPTGTVIFIANGTPARQVRFWWAYAPDILLEFNFRIIERASTALAHIVISLLLGLVIHLLVSVFLPRDVPRFQELLDDPDC